VSVRVSVAYLVSNTTRWCPKRYNIRCFTL